MALVWEKRDSDLYQVRRAGASVRLYTNGVFHSQYSPRRPVAGGVWDLLLLPAFARAPRVAQRILVLGVGGGAVIRQLNHFLAPGLVVGIELNPVHLYVARRFFDVQRPNVCLLQADALEWVAHYRGPPFDLIIEDLFGHVNGEPERVVPADEAWCKKLLGLLSRDGTLVMNFDSVRGLKRSAPLGSLRDQFASRWSLTVPGYDNHIGAFFRERVSGADFERNLQHYPELDQRSRSSALRYTLKPV